MNNIDELVEVLRKTGAELLEEVARDGNTEDFNYRFAKKLIDEGVTIPVKCKDCKYATEDIMLAGYYGCICNGGLNEADHSCSNGKKKEGAKSD